MQRYSVDLSTPTRANQLPIGFGMSWDWRSNRGDATTQLATELLMNQTFQNNLKSVMQEYIQNTLSTLLEDQRKVTEQAAVIERLIQRLEAAVAKSMSKDSD